MVAQGTGEEAAVSVDEGASKRNGTRFVDRWKMQFEDTQIVVWGEEARSLAGSFVDYYTNSASRLGLH